MSILCSYSRHYLLTKSINEIESDYDTDYESELKCTSTKPLDNHIDSDNKSNGKPNMKKDKNRWNERKAKKRFFKIIILIKQVHMETINPKCTNEDSFKYSILISLHYYNLKSLKKK